MTALVSTAYMEEALRFDRVWLMHEGRFLASGTPDELVGLVPGTIVEVKCPRQIDALRVLREHYPQVEPRGEWVRLLEETPDHGQASDQAVSCLPPDLKPTEVRTAEPELEDVFIALLRRREQKEGETASGATAVETYAEIPEEQKKTTAIEATELTRVFGDFTAVDHVTFQVKQGEIFGLLGANGAGKSTCIKMLTGILPPSSGEGARLRRRHAFRRTGDQGTNRLCLPGILPLRRPECAGEHPALCRHLWSSKGHQAGAS